MNAQSDRYFLGGYDLEMKEIAQLLTTHAPGRFEDKHLRWGASLSSYGDELNKSLRIGETPVLVELTDDLSPDVLDRSRIVVVDHHGPLAGADQPTSIEQVFRRLNLPINNWTRRLALVVANDRAHIAGMQAIGASPEELITIRAEDRTAQGVTDSDEVEAERAINHRRTEEGLTIIETHSDVSSAITDHMHLALGGPGYQRLIVVMPEKLAVFADGAAISCLADAIPDAWWGGNLPDQGFWGMESPPANRNAHLLRVQSLLRRALPARQSKIVR